MIDNSNFSTVFSTLQLIPQPFIIAIVMVMDMATFSCICCFTANGIYFKSDDCNDYIGISVVLYLGGMDVVSVQALHYWMIYPCFNR